MPYRPPLTFARKVNELATSLRDAEAAADENAKDEHLRRAMVSACDLLQSIDLPGFEVELNRVFQNGNEADTKWPEIMLGGSTEARHHFEFFLQNVEKAAFVAAGINEEAAERILEILRDLRSHAFDKLSEITPRFIVQNMEQLRNEVCSLKNEMVYAAEGQARMQRRGRAFKAGYKVLAFVAVVVDTAITFYHPNATDIAAIASVAVGGAAPFS
jgi:hypothetical protein